MKTERAKRRGWNPKAENRLRNAVVGDRPMPFEYIAERNEIIRHKWLEYKKAGHDIGSDRALKSWGKCHRGGWLKSRLQQFRISHPFQAGQEN